MARLQLQRGSSMLLMVRRLRSRLTQQPLVSATVTLVVYDLGSEVEVAGVQSWPLTASYLAGTEADYAVVIPETLETTHSQQLLVVIEANAGAGLRRVWRLEAIAVDGEETQE